MARSTCFLFPIFIVVRISDKIINQLQGKVDIVIIGGDLTEKGVPFQQVKENILKLKKLGTVFFVWGNNDHEVNEPQLDAMLLHLGVKDIGKQFCAYLNQKLVIVYF